MPRHPEVDHGADPATLDEQVAGVEVAVDPHRRPAPPGACSASSHAAVRTAASCRPRGKRAGRTAASSRSAALRAGSCERRAPAWRVVDRRSAATNRQVACAKSWPMIGASIAFVPSSHQDRPRKRIALAGPAVRQRLGHRRAECAGRGTAATGAPSRGLARPGAGGQPQREVGADSENGVVGAPGQNRPSAARPLGELICEQAADERDVDVDLVRVHPGAVHPAPVERHGRRRYQRDE